MAEIDHWIWAVPDLASATLEMRNRVGAGYFGGVHEGLGSANHIIPLDGDRYLEILGPSGEPGPYRAALQTCEPRMLTFAVRTHNLESMAGKARQLGLQTLGPYEGSRLQPNGATLRWRTIELRGHGFGNYLPFFIDWLDSPHPSAFLPAQAAVESFAVQYAADDLATIYQALDIPVDIRAGQEEMTLTLRTPAGVQMLNGYGRFNLLESRDLTNNDTSGNVASAAGPIEGTPT